MPYNPYQRKYEILQPSLKNGRFVAEIKDSVYSGKGMCGLSAIQDAANRLWSEGHKVRLPDGYEFSFEQGKKVIIEQKNQKSDSYSRLPSKEPKESEKAL